MTCIMRPVALVLLLALFWRPVLSQNTIVPGYIVSNGDTLRGQLKIDRERYLMHRVSFQRAGHENFTEYTPSDLTSFRYDDGPLYRTISFVNKAGSQPVAETLFGQTLVSGKYSLYSIDEDGDIYYVVKKDTATWFLYDDKLSVSGLEVIPGNYRNQLMFFSAGCDGLNIYKVPYSAKALTAFMLAVNQCQAPEIATSSYNVKRQLEVHYFVFMGGSNNQFTLDATARLIDPRFDPRASLNIGLHYSATGGRNQAQKGIFSGLDIPIVDTNANVTARILSIPVTVQYDFLRGRIQPAVYLGFSASYLSLSPPAIGSVQRFRVAAVAGACIEAYITPHIFLKADLRLELLVQDPSIGVGFKF